jgi:hypothetical protein
MQSNAPQNFVFMVHALVRLILGTGCITFPRSVSYPVKKAGAAG